MKYYLRNNTLFIRGSFRAASTGLRGGIGNVPTLLLYSVTDPESTANERLIENRIAAEGLCHEYYGILTDIRVEDLCILQYDFISAFILAKPGIGAGETTGTIQIIIYSGEGFSDAALLSAIITGTEAKSDALHAGGGNYSGTSADRMIIASEGPVSHTSADSGTEAGKRIRECILYGISRIAKENRARDRPALYVFSRFGEGHFAEWTPEDCPYYPCHFEGQRCDYCYCPFYPCGDEELGQYVTGSNGRRVWNCARCGILHIPEIADYFKRNPEASLKELKKFCKSIKK